MIFEHPDTTFPGLFKDGTARPAPRIPLSDLPVELQSTIFEFLGSKRVIHIREPGGTLAEPNKDGPFSPLQVCSEWRNVGKTPYLRSVMWEFASLRAARRYLAQATVEVIKTVQHVRIDVGVLDITQLMPVLLGAGCAIQKVTLISCSPENFGVVPNREDTSLAKGLGLVFGSSTAVMGNAPWILQDTTCGGEEQPSMDGIADSAIVQALGSVETLFDVAIEMQPCDICEMTRVGGCCGFRLLERKVARVVLASRSGHEVQSGQGSKLRANLRAIEEEAMPVITQLQEQERQEAGTITDDAGESFWKAEIDDDGEGEDTLYEEEAV